MSASRCSALSSGGGSSSLSSSSGSAGAGATDGAGAGAGSSSISSNTAIVACRRARNPLTVRVGRLTESRGVNIARGERGL